MGGRRAFSAFTGLVLAAGVLAASPAEAAVALTVPCSGAGGGSGGLIAAINAADSGGGGTITLASRCTYELSVENNTTDGGNGLPVVTTPITIKGNGSIIARDSLPATPVFRIFEVAATGNLTLQSLTLTGGLSETVGTGGAAILNNGGTTTLANTTLRGNTAKEGGAILNDHHGAMTIRSSLITGNDANGSGFAGGGGIEAADNSTLTVIGSQVSNNTAAFFGGGVRIIEFASAEIRSSVVNDNISDGNDGGISVGALGDTPGTLNLVSSSVRRNQAFDNGGIGNNSASPSSTTILRSSVVSDNTVSAPGGIAEGGGIGNSGDLQLLNSSSVVRNSVSGDHALGGGIFNADSATLEARGATIVNNTANGSSTSVGGGIFNDTTGTVTLTGSRVASNQATGTPSAAGGGIFNDGSFTLTNTTVSKNTPDNCAPPGSVAGCKG